MFKHLGTDFTQNTSPNNSIVASRSCGTDRVENTASQLLHWCVLRICCSLHPATVARSHYLASGLRAILYKIRSYQGYHSDGYEEFYLLGSRYQTTTGEDTAD
jgi:hypothetical protein